MPPEVPELDLRGLRCPLPALRTQKALRRMAPGARVWVLTDDPLAAVDIPHLCRAGAHRLVEAGEGGGARRFLIERGAPPALSCQTAEDADASGG